MKTEYLQVRVDEAFRKWLERAAKTEMRSISDMARYAILVYLAQRYPPTADQRASQPTNGDESAK